MGFDSPASTAVESSTSSSAADESSSLDSSGFDAPEGSGGAPPAPESTGSEGPSEPPEPPEPPGTSTGGADTDDDPPGAVDCDSPEVILCDSFEDGWNEAIWRTDERNGGSVTVDPTHAFEGSSALHVELTTADASRGMLESRPDTILPLPDNHFFGRMYVFAQAPDVPDQHAFMLSATGRMPNGERGHYRLDSNRAGLNSRYTTPTINQEVEHGGLRKFGYDLPTGVWVCVEWEYDGDRDEMRYWMDSEAQPDMTVLSSEQPPWIAPRFETLRLGFHMFHAADFEFELWIDALVLGLERIGC